MHNKIVILFLGALLRAKKKRWHLFLKGWLLCWLALDKIRLAKKYLTVCIFFLRYARTQKYK